MNRRKYILITTVIFDLCIAFLWSLAVFLGPNLYSYDFSTFVFACIGAMIIAVGNHIIAWLILRYINTIELKGDEVFFTDIKGRKYNYKINSIHHVLVLKSGYVIKAEDKVFRASYSQDQISIIIDGIIREEILPGDFPNAVYEIEKHR